MITPKKRGGKTARPKYLQELAKIAPTWATRIKKYGVAIAFDKFNKQLVDHSTCIVGEAHGFNARYLTDFPSDPKYCADCTDSAIEVIRGDKLNSRGIHQFIKHWKKEHGQ